MPFPSVAMMAVVVAVMVVVVVVTLTFKHMKKAATMFVEILQTSLDQQMNEMVNAANREQKQQIVSESSNAKAATDTDVYDKDEFTPEKLFHVLNEDENNELDTDELTVTLSA